MGQLQEPRRYFDRYSGTLVVTCLAFGLILRILALLDLKNTPYFEYLLWDERLYHSWAAKIADGTYASSAAFEASPLPAYVLAFVYKMFTPNPTHFRLMNIAFGVLTCYLIYLIGRKLAGRKVGIAACLVACLYEPFIFYSIVPLKTSMAVFLFALTVYLFLVSCEHFSPIVVLLLGTAAGLLFNVRPNSVVLLPLLPLLLLLTRANRVVPAPAKAAVIVLYTAGLSLSLSPFVIRNYRASGQLALAPTQLGFNLFLGNNTANPDPYYRPVRFASPSPYVQGIHFTIEASKRTGNRLGPKEASKYWTGEVLDLAWENPGALSRKLFLKTLVLFNQFEAGDHYHVGFMANFMRFFKFPFPGLWLILPLGLAGLSVTLRSSRKSLFLGLILLAYGATLVIFFSNARYRLPLAVGLVPFSVIGLKQLWSFAKDRNRQMITLYLAVAASFFVIEFLPVRATDDRSAYYNTHAIVLAKGSTHEAISYWKESSQMQEPFSAFADLSLAARYLAKKDPDRAMMYLNRIPDDSFAAAMKFELTGDVLMHNHQLQKAISAYTRSLEINSARVTVLKKLIQIYSKIDPEKAKAAESQLKYIQSFYSSSF